MTPWYSSCSFFIISCFCNYATKSWCICIDQIQRNTNWSWQMTLFWWGVALPLSQMELYSEEVYHSIKTLWVWWDRKELLTSWRASLATWCPTSGEEGKNKQKRTADDSRFPWRSVLLPHCVPIKWINWNEADLLKCSTFLIIFCQGRAVYVISVLIFKLRFIHSNKIRKDNIDHMLHEQSDGFLASSWTIHYNLDYCEVSPFCCHISIDWAKQMMSSGFLQQLVEYIQIFL